MAGVIVTLIELWWLHSQRFCLCTWDEWQIKDLLPWFVPWEKEKWCGREEMSPLKGSIPSFIFFCTLHWDGGNCSSWKDHSRWGMMLAWRSSETSSFFGPSSPRDDKKLFWPTLLSANPCLASLAGELRMRWKIVVMFILQKISFQLNVLWCFGWQQSGIFFFPLK